MTQAEQYILIVCSINKLERIKAGLERGAEPLHSTWEKHERTPIQMTDGSAVFWENGSPYAP